MVFKFLTFIIALHVGLTDAVAQTLPLPSPKPSTAFQPDSMLVWASNPKHPRYHKELEKRFLRSDSTFNAIDMATLVTYYAHQDGFEPEAFAFIEDSLRSTLKSGDAVALGYAMNTYLEKNPYSLLINAMKAEVLHGYDGEAEQKLANKYLWRAQKLQESMLGLGTGTSTTDAKWVLLPYETFILTSINNLQVVASKELSEGGHRYKVLAVRTSAEASEDINLYFNIDLAYRASYRNQIKEAKELQAKKKREEAAAKKKKAKKTKSATKKKSTATKKTTTKSK